MDSSGSVGRHLCFRGLCARHGCESGAAMVLHTSASMGVTVRGARPLSRRANADGAAAHAAPFSDATLGGDASMGAKGCSQASASIAISAASVGDCLLPFKFKRLATALCLHIGACTCAGVCNWAARLRRGLALTGALTRVSADSQLDLPIATCRSIDCAT